MSNFNKFKSIVLLGSIVASTAVFAGPKCTEGKADNWLTEETMKQNILDQGYKIKVFKESSKGCYEIYGWDKDGKKVEVYFHPVTGETVKINEKG